MHANHFTIVTGREFELEWTEMRLTQDSVLLYQENLLDEGPMRFTDPKTGRSVDTIDTMVKLLPSLRVLLSVHDGIMLPDSIEPNHITPGTSFKLHYGPHIGFCATPIVDGLEIPPVCFVKDPTKSGSLKPAPVSILEQLNRFDFDYGTRANVNLYAPDGTFQVHRYSHAALKLVDFVQEGSRVFHGVRLDRQWETVEGLTTFFLRHPRQVLLRRIFDSLASLEAQTSLRLIQQFLDDAPLDWGAGQFGETGTTKLIRATIRGTPNALADIKDQVRSLV